MKRPAHPGPGLRRRSTRPTPARGGSSTCLGAMGRARNPSILIPDHWGRGTRCSCRKPLILEAEKGRRHVRAWGRGLPEANFLP